jgi:hypothetical protein
MDEQLSVPGRMSVNGPPTLPPGWYPASDNGDQLRWWDGTGWSTEAVIRAPGWYEHPAASGTHVFFDGTEWTKKIRRRASRRAMRLMLLLAAVGIALVVWGGSVTTSIAAWSYPRELRHYYCSGEHDDELFAGIAWLWAIWLLLVAVSATATVVWRRFGRGDRRMRTLAILGGLSTAVFFPLWLVLGTGMGCSL